MENTHKITHPDGELLPLVFDSPHSGRDYPADFKPACPDSLLKNAEDNHVDDLLDGVPRHGGTLLTALFPRTYIDANRSVADIDTALLDDKWPGPLRPTARSHAGIGLIRRLVKPGVPVYDRKLKAQEIQDRIERCYHPYHNALAALLDEAHYNFGQVWHVNAHSMPFSPGLPDFVIGDRDGTSSGRDFTDALQSLIKELGYRVALNHPYKGAEILRRHAAPALGRHAVQLEIGKALYWDEIASRKSSNYSVLKGDIDKLISFCAAYVRDRLSLSLAAD